MGVGFLGIVSGRRAFGGIAAGLLGGILFGCDQVKLPEAISPGAEKSSSNEERSLVEKVLAPAAPQVISSVKLQLKNSPLETEGCFASLVSLGAGRPAVLKLASYRNEGDESFPSVFLQGEIQAASMTAVGGQKFTAQLFIQPDANGPVWHSTSEQPVEVVVTSANERALVLEIERGQLVNTHSDEKLDVQGIFSAAVN